MKRFYVFYSYTNGAGDVLESSEEFECPAPFDLDQFKDYIRRFDKGVNLKYIKCCMEIR